MNVRLPDGKQVAVAENACAADVASAIGPGLARAALAARVNGTPVDLSAPMHENDTVEIVTFDSAEGRSVFWHSSSHILAQAVQELFPNAKFAIGPAIESGFYYDFDVPEPFTPDDLAAIEKRCREIAGRKLAVERRVTSKSEARTYFQAKNEVYKLELLDDIQGDPSLYRQGEWQDLCRGPHIPNTGLVKAFKVLSCAGAYWRGNEKNKMLQRIYAISFPKQSMLDEHLRMLEEAQKRDHRKLGKELDLFSFHAEGAGFPFWHPKGMALYNAVSDFCRNEHVRAEYQEIKTPVILNESLWRRSGHWDKYRENMYFTEIDEVSHAVKPMNCPGGLLIFADSPHSYRDFPVKNFEFGLVHRHEKAGVLHGLFRVRQFTQDDAHIFCLPHQLEDQIAEVIDFVLRMYRVFGFDDFAVELSTRPEKFIGTTEVWDRAEQALQNVLDKSGLAYRLNPGDGAFYGPKIDFHIKDCLKRSWQCGTIQVDFSMPERFGLEYTDADGAKKRPVMIHRALLGSMERFIGILIEHYAGALPLWLAPVQAKILPVSDKYMEYAAAVLHELKKAGIRAELDARSEKVGYKIRDAEMKKVPYMAVVGGKEQDARSVSVRKHTAGDTGAMPLDEFIATLKREIEVRST
ncbi:MAG: threonine--tRNA ligase [Chitinivibrionales bacterium]|nr:threonine--tRNA ligase [Chitinivibrionales bacterium]MBD3394324.1 threonine--tRNA ligase [Chitinivibrionales bacterium]